MVVSHAAVIPYTRGIKGAELWRTCGPLGVDMFFALSGFLIGGILLETGDRLWSRRVLAGFWLNRWLRTLPSYYLFVAINVALWLWVYRSDNMPWGSITRTTVFLQNITHGPGWFFMEAWSLAVEEWFYLLVPLALFLGLAAGARFRIIFATVLGAMLLEPLIRRWSLPAPRDWGFEVHLVVLNKLDALGWDVAAVWLSRTFPTAWRHWATILALTGCAMLIECTIVANRPDFARLWFSRVLFPTAQPLACALLLPWATGWSGLRTGQPVIGALARWSYSLYLVNYNVCILSITDVQRYVGTDSRGCWIAIGVFVAVSVALAAGLYRWFERPFLRLRGRIRLCHEASLARSPSAPNGVAHRELAEAGAGMH